ncbi:hypothetical protein PIB30_042021 [Stylosanthes scabra]|uniref:Putative plant transposon protein domain-containing protein n=1 Tax=Stylosanthes scabra TaxID=79078 RepID=A0ABU6UEC9_9FABA|nr:hypothetical protein [Stylosanthes scabra]
MIEEFSTIILNLETSASPYGHVEVQKEPDGPKFTVNGQRLKPYLGGEIDHDTTEPTYVAHQQHFFEWVQNRTPNVEEPFQLHATEYPNITAEVERRRWHYLCNPIQGRLGITLLKEFYANAKKTKRERASNPPIYISHIRGKEIDYSPESLKVILQLSDVDVKGPSYEARKSSNDLRLGDMLRDIGEDHAQWKLDVKGNLSQLRCHDLKPTARGCLDFVRRSLMPTSNANEVTVDRKKVQGDKLIPIEKPITAESIMKNSQQQFPPQVHHQVHEERDEQEQHQQEQHFQPPPQQFDFPQPPLQNFPQEYNWQELTQQFQEMRVEQNNQFKDFFDRQNSFFEDIRTQTKAYKQGFEDLRVQ